MVERDIWVETDWTRENIHGREVKLRSCSAGGEIRRGFLSYRGLKDGKACIHYSAGWDEDGPIGELIPLSSSAVESLQPDLFTPKILCCNFDLP
jgi:hypothetical protein